MKLIRDFILDTETLSLAARRFIETLSRGFNTDIDQPEHISDAQLTSLLEMLSTAENLAGCEILFHIAVTALQNRSKGKASEQKEDKRTFSYDPQRDAVDQITKAKSLREGAFLLAEFYKQNHLEYQLSKQPHFFPPEKSFRLWQIIRDNSYQLTHKVEELLSQEMGYRYPLDGIHIILKPFLARIQALEKIAQGKLGELSLEECELVSGVTNFYHQFKKEIDPKLLLERAKPKFKSVIKTTLYRPDINTALQFAAHYGKLDQVKGLLAAKVDVHEGTDMSATAVHFAAASPEYKDEAVRAEILKQLVAHGAKLNATFKGFRIEPLYFAANVTVAKVLLQLGADTTCLYNFVYDTSDMEKLSQTSQERLRDLIYFLVGHCKEHLISLRAPACFAVKNSTPMEFVKLIIPALAQQTDHSDKDAVLHYVFEKDCRNFDLKLEVLPLLYPPREWMKGRLAEYLNDICEKFNWSNTKAEDERKFLTLYQAIVQHPQFDPKFDLNSLKAIHVPYDKVKNVLAKPATQQFFRENQKWKDQTGEQKQTSPTAIDSSPAESLTKKDAVSAQAAQQIGFLAAPSVSASKTSEPVTKSADDLVATIQLPTIVI